jgi:hypothetical protein
VCTESPKTDMMLCRISTPTGSHAKVLHSAPIEEGGDDARNSRTSLQGSPSRQLPQLGGAAGGMRVRVRVQDVGARSSGSGRGSNLPTSQRQRKRCAKCHLKAEGDLRSGHAQTTTARTRTRTRTHTHTHTHTRRSKIEYQVIFAVRNF